MNDIQKEFGFYVVLVVVITAIVTILVLNNAKQDAANNETIVTEWEDVEYCLNWGTLDRISLIVVCVDFVNETLKCQWQVDEELNLHVWEDDINDETVLACTRKVVAKQVVVQ